MKYLRIIRIYRLIKINTYRIIRIVLFNILFNLKKERENE